MAKLIFGCGYLGSRVARRWQRRARKCSSSRAAASAARQFSDEGLRPIVADVLQPESLTRLPKADTVLFAVGYDRSCGGSIYDVYVAGLRDVLASLSDDTRRFIYISSTGVYGQSLARRSMRRRRRNRLATAAGHALAAEQVLAADRLGERGIVLRMAGLYGPGRISAGRQDSPRRAHSRRRGELVEFDSRRRCRRGRVGRRAQRAATADLCRLRRPSGRAARVLRGARATARCCRRRSLLPPDPAAPRTAAARRATNESTTARMRAELDVELEYPSFREGLAAIVAGECRDS